MNPTAILKGIKLGRQILFVIPFVASVLFAQETTDQRAYLQIVVKLSSFSSDPIVLLSPGIFVDPPFDPNEAAVQEALSAQLDTACCFPN
jgi:hypothetical protein